MKKILLFFSILLVSGVAFNSCIYEKVSELEEEEKPDLPKEPKDERVYFLRINLESMRNSPIASNWSSYETVGFILDGDNNNSIYPNKKIDAGSSNLLLIDTIASSDTNGTGISYAPYVSFSGTSVPGHLSENQSQVISGNGSMDESLNKNMQLISDPAKFLLDEGTCQMMLKNVFSLIRLKIKKTSSLNMNGRTIKNIKLYIANENNIMTPINSTPLSGSYNINVKSSSLVPQFTDPSYSITAEITNSIVTVENTPTAWFVVNPLVLKSNEQFVVRVQTSRDDVFYSSFDLSPESNNFYDIEAVASEENTYIESVNERYVNTYSNCYIISEKGKYRFPVRQAIKDLQLTNARVDWLWASKERVGKFDDITELIDTSHLNYDGSNIMFQVGDNNPFSKLQKGNVILALKNQNNDIVWTWHIWITDEPKDVVYDGEGRTFLDRNIGALSANVVSSIIDNYGFVYQWGRKDPFIGGDGSGNETSADPMSLATKNTLRNTSATWKTTDVVRWSVNAATVDGYENIAGMPMRFVANNSASNEQPADWLSTSNQSLWSDTEKTDYDPCPDGYKVPGKLDLKPLYDAPVVSDFWYFANSGFRYWTYFYHGSGTTVWPSTGMRQGRNAYAGNSGGQLIYSGTGSDFGQCFYWTSTSAADIDATLSGASHRVYTDRILYSNDDYGDNADAYPIRCVEYIK